MEKFAEVIGTLTILIPFQEKKSLLDRANTLLQHFSKTKHKSEVENSKATFDDTCEQPAKYEHFPQTSHNHTTYKATVIRTLTRRARIVCDSNDSVANETKYLMKQRF